MPQVLKCQQNLVHRIGIDTLASCRAVWYRGVFAGLQSIGGTLGQLGPQPSDLEDREYDRTETDRDLHLRSGDRLKPDEVLARVQTVDDLRALIENEDHEQPRYFDWAAVVEHLTKKLASVTDLADTRDSIESWMTRDMLRENHLGRSLVALSRRFLELGDRAVAWETAERALKATNASGWVPYWDGGVRHAALRQLIEVDGDQARSQAIKLYADDLSERFAYPGTVAQHLYDVLGLLCREVPVAEVRSCIESYLDELFCAITVEPQPELDILFEQGVGEPTEDTPDRAIANLLALYLDHPSFPVAQGAVRACTKCLLGGSNAIVTALTEALSRTEEAAERALMVLDAASLEDPATVVPLNDAVERLQSSSNFAVRLTASVVLGRTAGKSGIPPVVRRETPAIYSLHLPQLASHRTELTLDREGAPVMIDDSALELCPLDIEARAIARAARLPEDNVLYRVRQHFRALRTSRTWLSSDGVLDPNRVSVFLDQIGLRHTYHKPHIAPARRAVAYVIAELYDCGCIPQEASQWLWEIVIHHDPSFILRRPDRRPPWMEGMGGISGNDRSYITLPEQWLESAENSLALLRLRTLDERVVLGEWTHLRRLQDKLPEEERAAVVMAGSCDALWDDLDVDGGHPPFARFPHERVAEYLGLRASADHVVIAHTAYDFETPGGCWLALNPLVGQELGWQPIRGGWFGWSDRRGVPVVESVWWADGPLTQCSEHLHT
jgi:hypothetical protein